MRAVDRLNLALFIAGQDTGVLRRIEVQTDDFLELVGEIWIAGELEAPDQVRFEAELAPDASDTGIADTDILRREWATPMRRIRRPFLDRFGNASPPGSERDAVSQRPGHVVSSRSSRSAGHQRISSRWYAGEPTPPTMCCGPGNFASSMTAANHSAQSISPGSSSDWTSLPPVRQRGAIRCSRCAEGRTEGSYSPVGRRGLARDGEACAAAGRQCTLTRQPTRMCGRLRSPHAPPHSSVDLFRIPLDIPPPISYVLRAFRITRESGRRGH